MPFRDRADAGRRLAKALARYRERKPVVLGLPRGGVVVAAEVARALQAPLDVLIVRKIGVPAQPELAMGAAIDGADPMVVRNDEVIALAGVSDRAFEAAKVRELGEIERRRARYLGDRAPLDVLGRTVLVVDDGIATGATVRAALRGLRKRQPCSIVLAVPVAPPETIGALAAEADAIVCLERPVPFGAIGAFYANFNQTDDEEVIALLAASVGRPSASTDARRS